MASPGLRAVCSSRLSLSTAAFRPRLMGATRLGNSCVALSACTTTPKKCVTKNSWLAAVRTSRRLIPLHCCASSVDLHEATFFTQDCGVTAWRTSGKLSPAPSLLPLIPWLIGASRLSSFCNALSTGMTQGFSWEHKHHTSMRHAQMPPGQSDIYACCMAF